MQRDESLGEPDAPLSRDAPFLRGFLWTLGALAALVLGLAAREASDALELVLVALFLAVGLNPIVAFAQRRGVPRGIAVLVVAIGILGVLATVVFVLATALKTQVTSLTDDLPKLIGDLRRNRTIAHLDGKYHVLSTLEKKVQSADVAGTLASGILSAGVSVLNGIVDAVVVFVLTLYFLGALPQLTAAAYRLAPHSRRERVSKLGDEILRRVGGFAIGALLVAFIAGTVTAILLVSVGLGRYALALALLVALLDLLPLVGSLIGAATVCLVALADSLTVGIVCIAFYVVYETLEGYVIYPRVMRSSVDVPEYVTIVAVLVGGAVGGIVGALMALPAAAAAVLLTREVWMRRQQLR